MVGFTGLTRNLSVANWKRGAIVALAVSALALGIVSSPQAAFMQGSTQAEGNARPGNVQTYEGEITNSRTEVEYTITLEPGQAVVVTMEATSGDLDTYLELYEAETMVRMNDDRQAFLNTDSALGYLSEDGGDYRLVATRYPDAESEGEYVLEVEIGSPEVLLRLNDLIAREEFTGDPQRMETEHFVIHYTLSGADASTESYIRAIAQTAEEVYDIEINQLGWALPPSDGSLGGDERYDIYVRDLIGDGLGALGTASMEDFIGDNPNTPDVVELNATTSYITMDNDYADTETDPIGLMRATVGHEYHHAIQFGYDRLEPANWYFEATSTWMETAAMGKDEDASGYVAYALEYPEVCLGYVSDEETSLQYGQWTFMYHLTELFGENAVRELWEVARDEDSFSAMQTMLERYNSSVPEVAVSYRLRDLALDYTLAERFTSTVWLEEEIDDEGTFTFTGTGVQELGANYFDFTASPGAYTAELDDAEGVLELWGAGINTATKQLDAFPLGSGGAFDTTGYDYYYLMVFNTEYDDDVSECVYYDYAINVSEARGGDVAEPTLQFDAQFFQPLDFASSLN